MQDIEAFMSVHFPHIPLEWLTDVNASLKDFADKNGGNVEMTTRFHSGMDEWTEWKDRRFKRRKPKPSVTVLNR